MGGSMTKVVIGLIMVAVLIIVFPIVMTATHILQTDEYTQSANVTTEVNATTADVVLTKALWNDDKGSVLSLTSTGASDNITSSSYAAATKTLTVAGLVANTTRTVGINFEYDALTLYTGMGSLVGITPLLIWIAVLATVLGSIWFAVRGSRGGG